MPDISTITRDLKALGPLAPVRAAYEVLKRSGMHGKILENVVSRAQAEPLRALPGFVPGHLSDSARARTLTEAGRIVSEGHRAFGRRLPVTSARDWSTIHPDGDTTWPTEARWWDIDIRTDDRAGDVKWTWEIGRHRDIVVLARAAYLEHEGQWTQELTQRLRWWFEATPLETSVHWYSNLEVAIRCIAWAQVHALVGSRLPEDLADTMALHVAMSRNHLLVDFPYTFSSMRNNHLLGDSLGLLVIEALHGTPNSLIARIAERSFADQLSRHMHSDGSMIEDSLSYHRFVLEMLAVKSLIGAETPESRAALRGASEHLLALGVLDGPVPQHGDWDEGRILADSGDPLSLRGSMLLGLALTGTALTEDQRAEHDELAWYAPQVQGSAPVPSTQRLATSGDITRLDHGGWTVWFKHGSQHSHQHADLSHVSVRRGGEWLVLDPGTGTYNGPLEVRNAFRTSHAHNGVRPHGEEMFEPHRAFRWLSGAQTTGLGHVDLGSTQILWTAHDAFDRLGLGKVVRAVVVTEGGVQVHDWMLGADEGVRTVAFEAGATVTERQLTNGRQQVSLEVTGDDTSGDQTTMTGWHSPTYGQWVPAVWRVASVDSASHWGVGVETHPTAAPNLSVRADGTTISLLIDGDVASSATLS